MIPGEIISEPGTHQLNCDRPRIQVEVANSADRPIQVGSHYHFYEVNQALVFERETAKGYRLDITSGTAVRFEPGQIRTVTLIPFQGKKTIFGFRALVQGTL
ncbi:urease subunit beta [Pseudoalteromonas phenolica]|uniref:urease subunit beta n=1 Tax=Pseudoalteromonas phenolica TaxID=161398 RepID=UPI00110C11F4|nr:urease subunit beta [Pseudoalteromonas phenolica]TMO55986.1 urease subunit beta [Pseudoalteromonas phenolica]